MQVVDKGTARRASGALDVPDGTHVAIGGKTGTGDNRSSNYGARGQLLGSRVLSRTATFVFFIGDRHFGTVTAYVPGADAENYRFTSALPVQILKTLAPVLKPIASGSGTSCMPSPAAPADQAVIVPIHAPAASAVPRASPLNGHAATAKAEPIKSDEALEWVSVEPRSSGQGRSAQAVMR